MIISTNTDDRKALAKAIAEELGTTVRYMGMPSCGYQIGDYIVDRDGNIVGEDFGALQDFLARNGYELPDQEIPTEAQADGEPTEEAPADSEADGITTMDISIPAYAVTPVQLKNLVYMLYSRQPLINRMTDSACLNIPDSLIDRLRENTLETAKAFTSWLDDAKADGLTGFDFRDSKVSMTFPFDETQPTKWTAYANLLNRIFDAAMKATRVFPERVEPDDQNEKYLAHVWLQRLNYAGSDYKAERKILLGHLKGYCAFANTDKQQAHKEKYTAIRRERRLAEQEAAVLEVMAEEGTGNE